MFLYEVIDAVESVKIKYAIVGGYALAMQGIVRATMDVDLVLSLSLKDFELVEQVSSLEDLLAMKMKSARPQDLVDIENIRKKIDEKKKK